MSSPVAVACVVVAIASPPLAASGALLPFVAALSAGLVAGGAAALPAALAFAGLDRAGSGALLAGSPLAAAAVALGTAVPAPATFGLSWLLPQLESQTAAISDHVRAPDRTDL